MKRDSNGRYAKANKDGYNLNVYIPSIKIMMYWILFVVIIFLWIVIEKFELLKKVFLFFERLMQTPIDETNETQKKMVYFIK